MSRIQTFHHNSKFRWGTGWIFQTCECFPLFNGKKSILEHDPFESVTFRRFVISEDLAQCFLQGVYGTYFGLPKLNIHYHVDCTNFASPPFIGCHPPNVENLCWGQWFSTFRSLLPTKQNKTKSGDPYIYITLLRHRWRYSLVEKHCFRTCKRWVIQN